MQDVLRPSVNHLARRLEHKCKEDKGWFFVDDWLPNTLHRVPTTRIIGGDLLGGDRKGAGTVNRT
jgi:hypothetical protein